MKKKLRILAITFTITLFSSFCANAQFFVTIDPTNCHCIAGFGHFEITTVVYGDSHCGNEVQTTKPYPTETLTTFIPGILFSPTLVSGTDHFKICVKIFDISNTLICTQCTDCLLFITDDNYVVTF
ncbi:MAG: hypothetical protein WCO63_12875 [Bacteroidota bacterium]